MTPLPGALGGRDLAWRIETTRHFPVWHIAEGAFRVGGRWSSPGARVLYTSIDPATAIVEVAVHKGLHTLDTVPHTLLAIAIASNAHVHLVDPTSIPDGNWLHPGTISAGQQAYGDALLERHPLVLMPSVVSTHSWNLLIHVDTAAGLFDLEASEPFALDPRLHPVQRATTPRRGA